MNRISSLLKVALPLAAVAVMSTTPVAAQSYHKMTRLGNPATSVCKGGISTAAQLQSFFAKNPARVNQILRSGGWAGNSADLFAAVAAGNFSETSYPVGSRFAWASSKRNGAYVALPYREWAGSSSMPAFRIDFQSGGYVYQMAVPKACCNISLVSGHAIAPRKVAVAPVVKRVATVKAQPAQTVKINPLALVPFFGAFVGSETRPRYESVWQMDRKDSSSIGGIRVGLSKELSAKTSLFGQLSYYKRNSLASASVYPDNNLGLDIGVDRKLTESTFIGAGIGAWNVDDSDFREASIFGHVGGDIGSTALQWFLEGRVFDTDSEMDSLSDNKMFTGGVRYLVK